LLGVSSQNTDVRRYHRSLLGWLLGVSSQNTDIRECHRIYWLVAGCILTEY
jgi:hypothetical protein